MAPFGFINDGLDDMSPIVDGGDIWTKENPMQTKEWNADEYGDNSFMWDYM